MALTKFEIDCSTAERKLTVEFAVDLDRIEAITPTGSLNTSKIVLQSGKELTIAGMTYNVLQKAIFDKISEHEKAVFNRSQED